MGKSEYLFTVSDLVNIYGQLLTSINNIWNIYVLVIVALVGWMLSSSRHSNRNKMIILVVFSIFVSLILFYFYDSYKEIEMIQKELKLRAHLFNKEYYGVFTNNFLRYDTSSRFNFVCKTILAISILISYIIMFHTKKDE